MTRERKDQTPAMAVELTEQQLSTVDAGIALLLPAVQQAREAASPGDIRPYVYGLGGWIPG